MPLFSVLGSISSTRGRCFLEQQKRARGRQRRQPRSGGHPGEASNPRASQCRSYASRSGRHRDARQGKTRRSLMPSGRRPQSEDILAVSGRDANKCRDLVKRHIRSYGHNLQPVVVRLSRFSPWETVSADIKENIQPEILRGQADVAAADREYFRPKSAVLAYVRIHRFVGQRSRRDGSDAKSVGANLRYHRSPATLTSD